MNPHILGVYVIVKGFDCLLWSFEVDNETLASCEDFILSLYS